MDKQMLQGMKDMQEAVRDFEERPSRIGDGLADLRNNKLPVNQLPEGVITGDVTADNVDSGAATEGQVLTANGTGGASWGTVEALPEITAGDEGKVLKVDSGAAIWGDADDIVTYDFSNNSSATIGDLYAQSGRVYYQKCIIIYKTPWGSNDSIRGFLTIAGPSDPTVGFIPDFGTYIQGSTGYTYYSNDTLSAIENVAIGTFLTDTGYKSMCYYTPDTKNLTFQTTYQLQATAYGTPVWAECSSGTQLYKHSLHVSVPDNGIFFDFVSTSATEITVDNVVTEFTKNIYHFNTNNDIVLYTLMSPNLSITSYQIQMAGDTLRIAGCVFGGTTTYAEIISISDTVTAL